MAVDATSIALRDELQNLSVVTPATVRSAIASLTPGILKVSQQISIIEQLLVAAEATEPNPAVYQKFEQLRQSAASLQNRQQKVAQEMSHLNTNLRQFQDMALDFIGAVAANE